MQAHAVRFRFWYNPCMDIFVTPSGVVLINATPHPITFRLDGGEEHILLPSGATLPATPEEEIALVRQGVTLVRTVFRPSDQGWKELAAILRQYPNALVVASIISAQAYGYPVVGLIATPDTARKPVEDRRYRADRFTVFGNVPEDGP